jgi:hypothetical protein
MQKGYIPIEKPSAELAPSSMRIAEPSRFHI